MGADYILFIYFSAALGEYYVSKNPIFIVYLLNYRL